LKLFGLQMAKRHAQALRGHGREGSQHSRTVSGRGKRRQVPQLSPARAGGQWQSRPGEWTAEEGEQHSTTLPSTRAVRCDVRSGCRRTQPRAAAIPASTTREHSAYAGEQRIPECALVVFLVASSFCFLASFGPVAASAKGRFRATSTRRQVKRILRRLVPKGNSAERLGPRGS